MYKDFIEKNGLDLIDLQENIVDNDLMNLLNDTGIAVLAACPSAGKTAMSIAFINEYLHKMGLKVLVLAHNQTILRKQYFDKINEYNVDFTYELVERGKDFANAKSDVVVTLPATINGLKKGFSRYDVIIVDEAHEYYGKKMLNEIIKKVDPKYQVLLTGTPSGFIARDFKITSISVNELLERGRVCDLLFDISTSTFDFDSSNYNVLDELKNDVQYSQSKTVSTLDNLLKDLVKRLTSINKDNPKLYANLTRTGFDWRIITNELDKTMIACKNVKLANKVYKYMVDRGVNCLMSHSKNDSDSENFVKFKEDKDVKVLIVVVRGGLGYNNEELVNFIDMTFSKNIDTTFQRYARVLRKHSQGKTKLFMKLVPHRMSDYFESIMDCVLCLTDKEYYEKFNGKNFMDFRIPERLNNSNRKSEGEGKKKSKKQPKAYAPVFLGQPLSFFSKVYSKKNRELEVYAWTTLREVREQLLGIKNIKESGYWDDKETCRIEASKYSCMKELKKNAPGCYSSCYIHGWLNEFYTKKYWNYESCKEESSKYSTITELKKSSRRCYRACMKNGWLYDFFTNNNKPVGFWNDKETCRIEASKYSNRNDFQKNKNSCYVACNRNGWLDEFIPKNNNKPVGFWNDKETCRIEASKYSNRTELRKLSVSCYNACRRNGWLDEFFPKNKR